MRALFCGSSHDYCIRFNAEGKSFNEDISAWDTSQVTDMYAMFGHADAFNQDIGGWDTARVTTMYATFWGRSQPFEDTVKAFNQPIGAWDVSKVTTMKDMFAYANSFAQDIDAWNPSSVPDMTDMFHDVHPDFTLPPWY